MRKRLLSLIIVATLSTVMLYGCGDKDKVQDNAPSQNQSQDNDDKDTSTEDETTTTTTTENLDAKLKEKFTEAISTIYNTDYSSDENVATVTEYIENNFTEDAREDMLNQVKNYTSKISSSDLIITLIKEIDNIDASTYEGTYEIRYTVTITEEKPFIYPDIIATVVIDKSGNVLINKINEGNF